MNYNMEIIEYNDKYSNDVKDLLVELEEYIVSIDKDELDIIHPDYREKMFLVAFKEIKDYNGKCFLAVENDTVLGFIIGIIDHYDEYDYLDYKCPKRGAIKELIVSNKARGKGIGNLLIKKIEEFFKEEKCEYSILEVFAYNNNAIKFYDNNGYHPRMYVDIKKL